MNKSTLALVLLLPFAAQAAETAKTAETAQTTETRNETVHKICAKRTKLARVIMRLRQKNTSIAEIINVFGTDQKWIETVKDAYSEPSWSSKPRQRSATDKFANNYYLKCARSFDEK
jgi:ADP-ribosylglycohydrolase|tara:strand:+ start:45 stop:395 length:351 start_codon:yes stop_codon:yes gene_type:complete